MKKLKIIYFMFLFGVLFVFSGILLACKNDEYTFITINFFRNYNKSDSTIFMSRSILKNDSITKPTTYPQVKEGYTFSGWYSDQKCTTKWDFMTKINNSTEIFAGWIEKKKKYYNVIFYLNNNTQDTYKETQVVENGTLDLPIPPQWDDHKFLGWYTKNKDGLNKEWDFKNKVTKNLNLFAKWGTIKKYKISFFLNEKDSTTLYFAPYEIKEGDQIKKPDDPKWDEHHTFKAWFKEKNCCTEWNFDNKVESDLNLYAKWEEIIIKTFTVKFYPNGGKFEKLGEVPYVEKDIKEGSVATELSEKLDYKGYEFLGWYVDKNSTEKWDFNTKITKNLNLYAGWEILKLKVTFYKNFSNLDDSIYDNLSTTVEYNNCIKMPDNPIREGFKFVNWITNRENNGSIFDFHKKVFKDLNLYALWESTNNDNNNNINNWYNYIYYSEFRIKFKHN